MKMSAQRLEAERNPSPMEMRSFLDVPMEDTEDYGVLPLSINNNNLKDINFKDNKNKALLSAGLVEGERVRVMKGEYQNIIAGIVSIEKGIAVLKGKVSELATEEARDETQEYYEVRVPLDHLNREFKPGDTVVVIDGEHKHCEGIIITLISKNKNNTFITYGSKKLTELETEQPDIASASVLIDKVTVPILTCYLRGSLHNNTSKASLISAFNNQVAEGKTSVKLKMGLGNIVRVRGKEVGIILRDKDNNTKDILTENNKIKSVPESEISILGIRDTESSFDINGRPIFAKTIVNVIKGEHTALMGTVIFIHSDNLFLKTYSRESGGRDSYGNFSAAFLRQGKGKVVDLKNLAVARNDQVSVYEVRERGETSERSEDGKRFRMGMQVKIVKGMFKTQIGVVKSVGEKEVVVEVGANRKIMKMGFESVKEMGVNN